MKKMTNLSNIVVLLSRNTIIFLLAFVFISLAISQYFHLNKEGFQEGLLTNTAVTNVKNALETYDDKIESICADSVKNISKLKLSQADSITFSSIFYFYGNWFSRFPIIPS